MDKKNTKTYYPNNIEKEENFLRHSKNREKFMDFCLGKNEYFYKNPQSYGHNRNRDHLTDNERYNRDYLWNEFNIWSSWKNAGKNIFDFSRGLIEMLKETDVNDTDLKSIKLPYEYFFIDLSEAKIEFETGSGILVDGVYVYEEINHDVDEDITYEKVIGFRFTGPYIDHFKHIQQYLYDHVRGFHDYSLFLDPPYKVFTVGDAVEDAKQSFVKVDIIEDLDNQTIDRLVSLKADFIDRTFKLVVNCLLYLSIPDKDIVEKFPSELPDHFLTKLQNVKTSRKREVIHQEIKNQGFTKIKIVGTNYVSRSKTGMSVGSVSTHWRKGHWRNQRFGENLNEKRLTWIKPTLVNKEKGDPQKGHIYSTS